MKWKQNVLQWLVNSIVPTVLIGIFLFFMRADTGMSVNANELQNIRGDVNLLKGEINEIEAQKADVIDLVDVKDDVKEIKGDVKEIRNLTIQVLTTSRFNRTQLIKFDSTVNGTQKKEK